MFTTLNKVLYQKFICRRLTQLLTSHSGRFKALKLCSEASQVYFAETNILGSFQNLLYSKELNTERYLNTND